MNKLLLHAEGLAVFLLSLYVYGQQGFSWILFCALLLAPDISMVGYIKDTKLGATIYNVFHTYVISIAVVVLSLYLSNDTILAIGIIWTAHIGMDRMFGYGLKYPTHFKDTHLNKV